MYIGCKIFCCFCWKLSLSCIDVCGCVDWRGILWFWLWMWCKRVIVIFKEIELFVFEIIFRLILEKIYVFKYCNCILYLRVCVFLLIWKLIKWNCFFINCWFIMKLMFDKGKCCNNLNFFCKKIVLEWVKLCMKDIVKNLIVYELIN